MATSRTMRRLLAGIAAVGLAGCDAGPPRAITPATPHTPPTAMREVELAAQLAAKTDASAAPDGGEGGRGEGAPQPAVAAGRASGVPGGMPGGEVGGLHGMGGPAPTAKPVAGIGGIGGGGIAGGIGGGIGGIGGIGGMPGGPVPQPNAAGGLQAQRDAHRGLNRHRQGHPGYDGLTQEQYRHFQDNAFRAVNQEPVSTFSADVNTAGYSNLRRYLTGGHLPPADAVRAAELLNFFTYNYPGPKSSDPVAFALAAMPCPWQPKHQLVRIGLKARQIDPAESPPRNLVFLIDTSGSMHQPTRLPLVQRSLGMLIDNLTAKDTVTVVTYAGSAGLKLPPTRGDQTGRIRAVVDGLAAGGSTNGAGGIALAYEQARANFVEGGCNRVILCTDGDFNVGVTAEGDLARLIERERAGNVFLTVLGYGMGNLKDATLEILARKGNGHYAYIDSDAEARRVFVEQGGALTAVAKDVKLQVEFNPAVVSAYRLLGYENRLLNAEDFKDDTKDAGDLGSGHAVTALYEVVPVGVPVAMPEADKLKYQWAGAATERAKSGEWLTAKMRYKHPEAADSREVAAVLTGEGAARPADADFRFAAAVAEFALLLRASKDRGVANYDRVLAAAGDAVGADPHGHRAEFVELVKQARRLTGVRHEAVVR